MKKTHTKSIRKNMNNFFESIDSLFQHGIGISLTCSPSDVACNCLLFDYFHSSNEDTNKKGKNIYQQTELSFAMSSLCGLV